MAIIGNTAPTLLDLATRMQGDGKISTVVELLHKTNEIIDDGAWIEANDGTSHKTTVRTGLPTATWRLLNTEWLWSVFGGHSRKTPTSSPRSSCACSGETPCLTPIPRDIWTRRRFVPSSTGFTSKLSKNSRDWTRVSWTKPF